MTRRTFSLFFCVALLLAQQGAFMHAAWHAHEDFSAHHQEQSDASLQGELCGLHGVFSQVLGGVEPGALHHAVPQAIAEAVAYRPAIQPVFDLLAPFSRGPPVFS